MNEKINRIKLLVSQLNVYRNAYYNENNPMVPDLIYDKMFDELAQLEEETNFIMSNSPTQTVGYIVKSKLQKTKHSHQMLSLDKTKDIKELIKFINNKDFVLSCKMDGLTILCTYENGNFIKAETRGNGEIGEDVTHTARTFENLPLTIPYKEHFEIEGEAIITYDDFDIINKVLPDDKKYKNPRNLASGSVRQLDSKIAKDRHIKFIAWKVCTEKYNSFSKNLHYAETLGFTVVPFHATNDAEHIEWLVEERKEYAAKMKYPIDGLVVTYDDIKYGRSLGMTGHHPKHSLAFKFQDDTYETKLKNIEWTIGKTGQLTPTAVFEPVEIDGTTIERASLHNVSIMENLELSYGDTITVYKANQIIPQIEDNLDRTNNNPCMPPEICSICGSPTEIVNNNGVKVLFCSNYHCKGKLLSQLCTFVSKDAHDIAGLSEARLSQLIDAGLVEEPLDLYHLSKYRVMALPRMGEKSAEKLLTEIEKSKSTTLSKFLYSLSIPLIGRSASKALEKYETMKAKEREMPNALLSFMYDIEQHFDFSCIGDFGSKMNQNLYKFFNQNMSDIEALINVFNFPLISLTEAVTEQKEGGSLNGKSFCITGKLVIYKNRDELVHDIEIHGGKVVSGVTKKIDYLITNDKTSGSSKNKKAAELNIPIISEAEFKKLLK